MAAAAELRRRSRLALVPAALALVGCASLGSGSAATAIADGVYLLPGVNEIASPANRGDIGNAGFVVGPAGIAVIEAGGSLRAGRRLQSAIAASSRAPIRVVVLTQALPEFVLGASAFEANGTPLLAQRQAAERLQSRCEHCLANLRDQIGDEALRGTEIASRIGPVDSGIEDDRIGRPLRLIHPGRAATPGDLAVFDPASGVLFAGALVENHRIPNLQDGELDGWIAALEELRALPLKLVVPGHGAAGGIELIDDTLAYLRALDAAVRARYAAGASLSEAIATVRLEPYAAWIGYAEWQGANVQHRYREIENSEFDGRAP